MSEKTSSLVEKGSRFYRNINVLGAAALVGAGVLVPEIQPVVFAWAAINIAQAGLAEVVRRMSKSKPTSAPAPA